MRKITEYFCGLNDPDSKWGFVAGNGIRPASKFGSGRSCWQPSRICHVKSSSDAYLKNSWKKSKKMHDPPETPLFWGGVRIWNEQVFDNIDVAGQWYHFFSVPSKPDVFTYFNCVTFFQFLFFVQKVLFFCTMFVPLWWGLTNSIDLSQRFLALLE